MGKKNRDKAIKKANEELSKEEFENAVKQVKKLLKNIRKQEDDLKQAKLDLENWKKGKPSIRVKDSYDGNYVTISSTACDMNRANISLSCS